MPKCFMLVSGRGAMAHMLHRNTYLTPSVACSRVLRPDTKMIVEMK